MKKENYIEIRKRSDLISFLGSHELKTYDELKAEAEAALKRHESENGLQPVGHHRLYIPLFKVEDDTVYYNDGIATVVKFADLDDQRPLFCATFDVLVRKLDDPAELRGMLYDSDEAAPYDYDGYCTDTPNQKRLRERVADFESQRAFTKHAVRFSVEEFIGRDKEPSFINPIFDFKNSNITEVHSKADEILGKMGYSNTDVEQLNDWRAIYVKTNPRRWNHNDGSSFTNLVYLPVTEGLGGGIVQFVSTYESY
jgi:hypothetical protein